MFPQVLNNLEENMKALTGKEEPLKKAMAVGAAGNFSEDNCFPRKAYKKRRQRERKR
jgi:hypothetical protein